MFPSLLKGFLSTVVFICFLNADTNNTQDIVDIVDYRFDKIRDNIYSDITKIKSELGKIKEQQVNIIDEELLNIDRTINDLEDKLTKTIKDRDAFEKEFYEGIERHNNIIIKHDKKIDDISSSMSLWAVGILLIGFFTAIISFFIARIYSRKAREDAAKEVDTILKRWIKQRDEEYLDEEKRENKKEDELKKQIEFWKSRYEELRFNDKHLVAEFKKWAKNIEDKEIKNRIKKYIKKLKKDGEPKGDFIDL